MHTASKQSHRVPHLRIFIWKEDSSLPAMFKPLCISNCLKRTFVIKVRSHYIRFPQQMEAITCLPQNRHFSWWTKMNGTQRRAVVQYRPVTTAHTREIFRVVPLVFIAWVKSKSMHGFDPRPLVVLNVVTSIIPRVYLKLYFTRELSWLLQLRGLNYSTASDTLGFKTTLADARTP